MINNQDSANSAQTHINAIIPTIRTNSELLKSGLKLGKHKLHSQTTNSDSEFDTKVSKTTRGQNSATNHTYRTQFANSVKERKPNAANQRFRTQQKLQNAEEVRDTKSHSKIRWKQNCTVSNSATRNSNRKNSRINSSNRDTNQQQRPRLLLNEPNSGIQFGQQHKQSIVALWEKKKERGWVVEEEVRWWKVLTWWRRRVWSGFCGYFEIDRGGGGWAIGESEVVMWMRTLKAMLWCGGSDSVTESNDAWAGTELSFEKEGKRWGEGLWFERK